MRLFWSLVVVARAPRVATADDWPQWLGPKRDGVWRETGIVEKFPAGGPKIGVERAGRHRATPARRSRAARCSSPTTCSADGPKLPDSGFAKGDGRRATSACSASTQKTGKELWKHEYPVEYTISYAGRAALHARRGRRPRLHPRRDGRPVLPRTSRTASWSGRRTSSRTTTPRLPRVGLRRAPAGRRRQAHLPRRRVERPARRRVRQEDRQGTLGVAELRRRLRLLPADDLRVRRQAPAHHLAHAGGRRARPGDRQAALARGLRGRRPRSPPRRRGRSATTGCSSRRSTTGRCC